MILLAAESSDVLAPYLTALIALIGVLLAGWIQGRANLRQTKEANAHSLNLLREQFANQESQRQQQNMEAENADRLRVLEYVELLIPRLEDIAEIEYLASNNLNSDELESFLNLQRYISVRDVDPASPQKTLGLRIAFIIFQIAAALRLALLARWTRPISSQHARFLNYWEMNIEPVICSGRYPGKQLLYREQLEIAAQEMITLPETTQIPHPLNWHEFVNNRYRTDHVLKELAHFVSGKLEYIFEENGSLANRKEMQCRLAIMGIYMVRLAEEAGAKGWSRRLDGFWKVVLAQYRHEIATNRYDGWFVFERGDVATRANEIGG